MPRIRTLKPEIWSSAQVMNLSMAARLLFVGLITQADDEGRGSADPRKLRGLIFPGDDDITAQRIGELLAEIRGQHLAVLYRAEPHGELYSLPSWRKHQRINRPSPSSYPPPSETDYAGTFTDDSVNAHGTITGDRIGEDRIGEDRKGSDRASPSVPQAGPKGASASPGELDLQATESPQPDPVQRVFDHWREVHGHRRAVLDAKRRKLIGARLREYSADDLCRAISGYRNSPHHQGRNDRGTVYDDLALLLRDAGHVDAGLRFAERPPVAPQAENASQRIARKVAARAADRQAIEGETVPALESFA